MQDTGFQEGIGPLPKWDATYAISADRRAYYYMLANADAGGAYSVHYRDEKTGYPISIDDYPNTSIADPAGSDQPLPEPVGTSPYSPGNWSSHQPSIGYLPYLVTGDYYYLEEAQFWSAYNLIWPSNVGWDGNPGRNHADGLWYTESLRGQAWAYRSLAQVAYATPDDHPTKSYWLDKMETNLARDHELYVHPGGAHKNRLGAMFMAEGNEQYRFYDYFMSWVVQYIVDLGFKQAIPFRDYKLKFPIGLMGAKSDEYCFQSAPRYAWKTGPGGTYEFYPTFRAVYENTVPDRARTECGTDAMASLMGLRLNEMDGEQNSTTYWFAQLQPALAAAYDSGLAGGKEAWKRAHLSGIHPDYKDMPIWAVIPHSLERPDSSTQGNQQVLSETH